MAGYKTKVISLTKKPSQIFGFYLRVETGEEGHLIRCLEMGGPAELAGMKDGDRIIRVNGTFVEDLTHPEVVDLVRNSGPTVTFHILDEVSYKQAKAQGVNLSEPNSTTMTNGVAKQAPKPKLCYLVNSSSGFGFSLRSVKGEAGLFMTDVTPGGVANKAGVQANDRLVEVNGENIESYTHDQVVNKIKLAGSSLVFLLADDKTDLYYRNKHIKVGAWLATSNFLPHKPRIIHLTKGPDGYGFLLRQDPCQKGHIINNIDKGSPAERGGLKDKDRLVAVDGVEVDGCSHEQVVDRIRESGNKCCLLVVDTETDQIYTQGKLSPMVFWEERKDILSPPTYTEAVTLPAVQPPTPVQEREVELKPKLCKMEKTADGFGFHLNGIQGVFGQYITQVVQGGAADRAGLEDNDIVVEINGYNVEETSHEESVEIIRGSGSSLELLVACRSVYDKLKAKGVTITRRLLADTSEAQVHTAHKSKVDQDNGCEDVDSLETSNEQAKERNPSMASLSSVDSDEEKL